MVSFDRLSTRRLTRQVPGCFLVMYKLEPA